MTPTAKAQELRRLHHDRELLVLVNAWDVASARTIAAAPGCRALATASWSIAAAHGVPDGEAIGRAAMLEAIARIAAAVELPVTADLEGGYGETAAEVGDTVAGAIAAGAVGCNLEDSTAEDSLRAPEEQAERIAAARGAGEGAGVPLVINARTDVFLTGEADAVEQALQRGRAYLAAGADCVFAIGASDPGDLRTLVDGMGGPVSVIGTPRGPSLDELQELGVARVTFGPGPLGVAMAALRASAETLLARGPLDPNLAFRP